VTIHEPFANRQIRAAMSESACRDENELTEERGDSSAFTEFACECTLACTAKVSLTSDEYERVRHVPTHFLAAPGHLIVGVEVLVLETPRYHVVEKIGAAAAVAARLDPRAATERDVA
jgi:hypothetical protein